MPTTQAVCLNHFTELVPAYHARYQSRGYCEGYCELVNCLPGTARRLEGLDKKGVLAIFAWGGGQQYKGKFEKNTAVAVRARTVEAYQHRHSPADAYRAVTYLEGIGLTYWSKTLRFMEPESYVALDGRHMRPILGALIGVARDGLSPRYQVTTASLREILGIYATISGSK